MTVLVENSNASFLGTLITGAVITLGTFLIYFFLKALFRKFALSGIFVLLISAAFIGAVRGLFFYNAVEFLNLEQPSSVVFRILNSALNTLFWLTIANLIVNSFSSFRSQYQIALRSFLVSNSKDFSATLSAESSAELDQLQQNIKNSLGQFLEGSNKQEFQKMAEVIKEQINQQLRPLSQRMWVRSLSEYPVIRYQRLIRDALEFLSFGLAPFVIVSTVLSVIGNIALRQWDETLWRTVTYLGIALVLIKFKPINNSLSGNSIFLIVFGLISILGSEFLVQLIGYQGNWEATFLIVPIPPVIALILSIFSLTSKDHQFILSALTEKGLDSDIRSSSKEISERSNLASFLHNSLQSELLALSKQLEEAAKSEDQERSAELFQRVTALSNRSLAEDFAQFSLTPLARLKLVIEAWEGILDISVDIEDIHLKDEKMNQAIVQTIEEVASNTSRHSAASKLHVTARPGKNGLIIELQSNGFGAKTERRGLGSSWLDQIAKAPWSIEQNNEGTLVRIEI